MRAVFDTVIFVRALINPNGRWGRVVFHEAENYILVISTEIMTEVLDVIYRPELHRRFPEMSTPPRLDRVLGRLAEAEIVEPNEHIEVCRDPKDNKFFECALAGRAEYIVSEDRDILDVGEYEGIKTLSAEEFLAILSAFS